jgi:hypothetical protein
MTIYGISIVLIALIFELMAEIYWAIEDILKEKATERFIAEGPVLRDAARKNRKELEEVMDMMADSHSAKDKSSHRQTGKR